MKKCIVILFSILSIFSLCAQPVTEETEAVTLNIAALKGPTAMGMVELMETRGDN